MRYPRVGVVHILHRGPLGWTVSIGAFVTAGIDYIPERENWHSNVGSDLANDIYHPGLISPMAIDANQ